MSTNTVPTNTRKRMTTPEIVRRVEQGVLNPRDPFLRTVTREDLAFKGTLSHSINRFFYIADYTMFAKRRSDYRARLYRDPANNDIFLLSSPGRTSSMGAYIGITRNIEVMRKLAAFRPWDPYARKEVENGAIAFLTVSGSYNSGQPMIDAYRAVPEMRSDYVGDYFDSVELTLNKRRVNGALVNR